MKNILAIILISFISLFQSNATNLSCPDVNEFLKFKIGISNVEEGPIDKALILETKKISFNDKEAAGYRIVAYKLTLVVKSKDIKAFSGESNEKLTEAMLDAIRNAPSGSKLFFEYIKCTDQKNVLYSVGPASFILK